MIKRLFEKLRSQPASIENIYRLDGRVPVLQAIPFGLQHILAMFVANIAPVMIVAGVCGLSASDTTRLIQTAMIIAGIGTLIQICPLKFIGSRLPIVMGISFTFVSVFCYVGPLYGYSAVIGAVLVGGIVEGLLGLLAKYWRHIIAPIVSACVVTAIGFSLLSIGANSFAGGTGSSDFGAWQNWLLGGVTLIACLVFHVLVKGHLKQLSVLFGLVVGYVLALFMGKVDFSAFEGISVVSFPHIMPYTPEFNISAIFSVIMIFLVSATETIGDTSAFTAVALKREPTDKEISGSLCCDGLISSLSSIFGCLPITSFSQNVGLITMTKVVNRFTIGTGAVLMIVAGFIPAVGALFATLPESVLGGCTIMMFGNIVVSGLQMIEKCGFSQRNITIIALSLGVGLGFTQVPEMFDIFPNLVQTIFAENCVAVVFILSIFLNLFLPKEKVEEEA
ncbi:MAG: purine permease [Oscillospiraceae bacterium]|nr:purine permease [Oscillospiraceae bacterium]